jgi:hypothetical protein
MFVAPQHACSPAGLWNKSHWQPQPSFHRVAGMNLPADPPDDRRTVPRHIRDGEHDVLDETKGSPPREPETAGRRARWWIYFVALGAAGFGVWFSLRGDN